MNLEQWIKDIEGQSVYWLADQIYVQSPDTSTSHGAVFLADIRSAFISVLLSGRIEDEASARDVGSLIGYMETDGGVAPNYTQAAWITYVDLCLWAEDIEEYTGSSTPDAYVTQHMYDMLQGCSEKLCMHLWHLYQGATAD